MTAIPAPWPVIGAMAMPEGFKYKNIALAGRPIHQKYDRFWMKHPPMSPGRRAKIFSPFAALEGFDDRIAEKEVLYERQAELCVEDKEEINRRLAILRDLTRTRRMAGENHVIVSIRCFVPCTDPHHSSFGYGGQYENVTGMVIRVERDRIIIFAEDHEKKIPFDVIREIKSNVFDM